MKKIPTGIKSFRKLREENYYFVDKTRMIKDFLERGSEVTLVTRPRKFEKTINMSMLSEFFDITKDYKEIFKGTKIMDTPYASELNQYPTIFISFADAKRDKASIVSTIKDQVLKEWDRYVYVFDDLSKYEQNKHDFLESRLMNYSNGNLEGIVDSISFLMDKLKDYYHKEVMVFIDEYDTPFVEAHTGVAKSRLERMMIRQGMMVKDLGTILVGKMAVEEGIIDEVGGVSEALFWLHQEIERSRKKRQEKK